MTAKVTRRPAEVEDGQDVRMIERRHGPRLALERPAHQRCGEMLRQDLERDLPLQT